MIVLLMSHRQPLLHELFSALGVDADAHWIAGRRGILSKNLPHLVEQTNRRIQKIFGRKLLQIGELAGKFSDAYVQKTKP